MKKTITLIITCLIVFCGFGQKAELYEPGKLFVQVKTEYADAFQHTRAETMARYQSFGITSIRKAFTLSDEQLSRVYLIEFTRTDAVKALMNQLQQSGLFTYVEEIPVYQLDYTPNDLQNVQWNLKKIGAEKIWDTYKGDPNIVIAMVDDALDTAHVDLHPAIWHNKNEVPGNGSDDDGNGYIDDYVGWDAADADNDPTPDVGSGLRHGTHCAGIAGAMTDNNIGIASLAFRVSLMAVKIGRAGSSSLVNPYDGVAYAIANNANIISMSWGGGGYSNTYQLLFNAAYAKGIICVAAAGNSSTAIKHYPAAYNHVIAVGSTTSSDQMSSFSNYGSWIDIVAPGSNIYSTLPGNTYGYLSGTSMACPLVSGLCALMLSKNPLLTPSQIEACMKGTAKNIDSANPSYKGLMGGGRIDAFQAVSCVRSITAVFTSSRKQICPSDTVTFYDKSLPASLLRRWTFTGGTPSFSTAKNPVVAYATAGTYDVQLIVSNAGGADTIKIVNYITVAKPTALISGAKLIYPGNTALLRVDLTGNMPWSITYSDGSVSKTISNIVSTPYYISVSPKVSTAYSLTAMSDNRCTGNVSGSAKVIVRSVDCNAASKYQLTFGGTADDQAHGIIEDNDGNILVAGNTLNYGNGDGFLAKFSPQGNMLWYKTYGGTAADVLLNVVATDDNGYMLVGYTRSSGMGSDDAWIIKTDSSGAVTWSKTIGGSDMDWGWSAVQAHDKGILIYGYTKSYGAGDFDNYLIKLDSSGNLKWTKTYGNGQYSMITGLVSYPDGSMIFSSNYRTSNGEHVIAKADSSGNLLWSYKFGSIYDDGTYSIVKGNDDNVYMAGATRSSSTNQEIMVASFTPSGTMRWVKNYTGTGTDAAYGIASDGNNLIIVGQTTSSGMGGADMFALKIDTLGNVLSGYTYGGTSDDIARKSINATDGSVYVLGFAQSFSAGVNDIMLNKAGCGLAGGCNYKIFSPAVTTPSMTVSSENQSTSSGGTAIAYSLSAVSKQIGIKSQCKYETSSCIKVSAYKKISRSSGNFSGNLDVDDRFGYSTVSIGDIDDDGVVDICAGAQLDDDGSSNAGAVYILFMKSDGTVKSYQKISATQGNFTGSITGAQYFGSRVAALGDLDGDNIEDIAVSAHYDNAVGTRTGAFWILFLKKDGTVKSYQKITSGVGGFTGSLQADDRFGLGLANLGDLDGDGVIDIGAGAQMDQDGGTAKGAIYILYMKTNGTVKSYKKISDTQGGITGVLKSGDSFGFGLASMGDIDGDGVDDIAVGSRNDNDGGTNRGAVWILFMNTNGTVKSYQKVSSLSGNFYGLDDNDEFASDVKCLNDIDNDGINELLVSANYDDDGGTDRGAVWILYLKSSGVVAKSSKISALSSGFKGYLDNSDWFGTGIGIYPDVDGNGVDELLSGAVQDDDVGTNYGAFYILSLEDTCALPAPVNCKLKADFAALKVCITDTTSFTDLSKDSLSAVIKWKWDFGDGNTLTGIQDPKHKYAAKGAYDVKLVVYNNADNACSDSIVKKVEVTDKPELLGKPDITICSGGTVRLGYERIICAKSDLVYHWTPSAGLNDTAVADPMAHPLKTTSYILTVSGPGSLFLKDTITVTVDTTCCKSTASFMVNTVKCIPDTFKLVNISDGKPGVVYKWTFSAGGNLTSYTGINPPPLIYKNPGNYTLKLNLDDICGQDSSSFEVTLYPRAVTYAGRDSTLCKGDTVQLGDVAIGRNQYEWLPALGLNDSHISDPKAVFVKPVAYRLKMTDENGCVAYDTVNLNMIKDPVLSLGNDTAFCEPADYVLNTDTAFKQHLWQNGSTLPDYHVTKTGLYWVKAKARCWHSDSVYIELWERPSFTLGKDTSICKGEIYQISADKKLLNYLWHDGDTIPIYTANKTGLYVLESGTKCKFRDSIQITVLDPPVFTLGKDTSACHNYTIKPDKALSDYLWQDGSKNPVFIATTSGKYWLRSGSRCYSTDTVNITILQSPVFSLGNDTLYCDTIVKILHPGISTTGLTATWYDQSSDSQKQVSAPGKYWLKLDNGKCSYADTISITLDHSPSVNIGNDTNICSGDILILDAFGTYAKHYLWQDGSTNSKYNVQAGGTYKIVVSNDCGNAADTLKVLETDCRCDLFVPNAFSPNHTETVNDIFKPVDPVACESSYYLFEIYDRWGEKLFSTTDKTAGWDGRYKGKRLPPGTYIWVLNWQQKYQNQNRPFQKAGSVTILD